LTLRQLPAVVVVTFGLMQAPSFGQPVNPPCPTPSPPRWSSLADVFSAPEAELQSIDPHSSFQWIEDEALDEGERALADAGEALAVGRGSMRQSLAAHCAAIVGGPVARDILETAHGRIGGDGVKSELASCMASTGSRDDVRFLIRALEGEQIGDHWGPIVSAALALGVIRAEAARDALQACAARGRGTIASHAAAQALAWIRTPPVVPSSPGDSVSDRIVKVVFRCGIPGNDASPCFTEREDRVWVRSGNTWLVQPACPSPSPPHPPSILPKIHFGKDGRSALVRVTVWFGPMAATYYTYVLRNVGNRWRVTALFFAGIS